MIHDLFDRVFGPESRVFLPVVHVRDNDQARRNVGVALEAGADGVFLIDMGYRPPREFLRPVYEAVRGEFPSAWIGLNFLGAGPSQAIGLAPECASGVWADDAGMPNSGSAKRALHVCREREGRGLQTLYFGGVAHKASSGHTSDPEAAAEAARGLRDSMHVVTTSGSGTGLAASIDKLRAMVTASGEKPLAVASGVGEHNVGPTLGAGVRAFLVASSIEKMRGSDELDPEKTRRLAELIHAC